MTSFSFARFALAVAALVALPLAFSSETDATAPASIDAGEARVIVKYKSDSTLMRVQSATRGDGAPRHAHTLSRRLRVALSDGHVLGKRTQSLRGRGMSSSQLAARLALQPDVEWAVPVQRRHILALPNDPLFAGAQPVATPTVGQWYARAPDITTVGAMNAAGAWDITSGSAAVTVAVLDTGVRLAHPDLAGKLHPGYDFVHDIAVSNDGDGRDANADDPGDWANVNDCGPGEPATPSSWHGTQVAGLIGAATNNGIGMAGVGRNVMVLPVRVLGRCGGWDDDIIAAARWAAGLSSNVGFGGVVTLVNANPAKVINMSFGSSGLCPQSYADLIAEANAAGVTVVAAAGNDDGLAVNVPANCPGAIAVGGIRHVGTKVTYSSLGPEVAIAAPAGNCVNLGSPCLYPLLSTSNSGLAGPVADVFTTSNFNTATLGTSFSSPLVAGTIGLMLSVNSSLSPAQIRTVLQTSARAFPTTGAETVAPACHAPNGVAQAECYCTTSTCGAGMLDAGRAVALAANPGSLFAGSSSGGGAFAPGWLLGLLALSGAALAWRRRQP